MYTLSHLKNCFKCMCLDLEFECFASKAEMTTSYAWRWPLSLCWWHVLLSVTCDRRSSAVHSWLDVCQSYIKCSTQGSMVWWLAGWVGTQHPQPVLLHSSWVLGKIHTTLHWFSCELYSSIWVRHSSVAVVQCSLHVSSIPYLTEMSCRQMPLIHREPVRGFVLKLTAGFEP